LLLAGKKLLITGVLTPGSIAYDCARIAQDEGAEVLLTGFGRGMSLTQRSARRLSPTPEVLEVDVNNGADLVALTADLQRRWGRLDWLPPRDRLRSAGYHRRPLHDRAMGKR